MGNLRDQAASGGALRKFATGEAPGPDIQTIYGLVQCTPDLSEDQCRQCLQRVISQTGQCCNKQSGLKSVNPSCNLRYEVYTFYNETKWDVHAPPPPPPPDTGVNVMPRKRNNTKKFVVIAVAASLSFLIVLVCIILMVIKRKQKKQSKDVKSSYEISTVQPLQYDFTTIRKATDEFSESNKLGEGGFGAVYKGKLLCGQEIAVKRLTRNSRHGQEQFKNEVVLMVKLQHRNLVRLLGFCLEGTERLLIYEFVINSSLDNFIFDLDKRANLDWEKRRRIIEGVARGILYLHEDAQLRIIHRDLKASNILLDAKMNPKIADFGTARLFELDETRTSMIAGTYGYMAPENLRGGHISVKLDVFSFGVLVLEIVSGQKNSCFRNGESTEEGLLSHTWKSWKEGRPLNVIDPVLRRVSSNPQSEMIRCVHIGLLCVQENASSRPTMASVLLMLSSYSVTLPVPSQPAFFVHSGTGVDTPLEDFSQLSKAEDSITELHPR